MTLKDIREQMLSRLSNYAGDVNGDYYDEDGHCGDGLWSQIREFWDNFKTDDDFIYVVSGRWFSDDLDLGGGRSYLLSGTAPMLFDYMYNTLGWTQDTFREVIFNSTELSDEIDDMFEDVPAIRDMKIDTVLDTPKKEVKNLWESIVFEETEFIPQIVMYPKFKQDIIKKFSCLELIGPSKANSEFLCYRIKELGVNIPKDYKVVKTVEHHLK